jgi:hypothetical protein
MKFGQKVKAYAGSEEPRVGFVASDEPDSDGKWAVQVGDGIHVLAERDEVENGPNGGTFSKI